MAWTTKVPVGGSITVNGVEMTFDRCTQVRIHNKAQSVHVKRPDGSSYGWDLGLEPGEDKVA